MFNAETITNVANAAYVVAALLFILALAGLSKHETSKAGNAFGMAGMGVALVATIVLAINKHIEPLGLALLMGALRLSLKDRNIPLWLNTPARRIIMENGRVAGVQVEHEGKKRCIRADRGVNSCAV